RIIVLDRAGLPVDAVGKDLMVAASHELLLVTLEKQNIAEPNAGGLEALDHLEHDFVAGNGVRFADGDDLDSDAVSRREKVAPRLHGVFAADQFSHAAIHHRLDGDAVAFGVALGFLAGFYSTRMMDLDHPAWKRPRH